MASLMGVAELSRVAAQLRLTDLLERVASGGTKARELERVPAWA